jgi:radical SAM protein (TIGR01212 family)
MIKRYNDLNACLRDLFGVRVQKITIDAGLTCPNRDGSISTGGCIYCNARGSGTGAHARGLSIKDQLRMGKKALRRRYNAIKFIAYFQSFSNTYAPVDTLKRFYEEALSVEDVVGLSIGTRPDCVNGPILDLLENYAKDYLIWVEYGLQSAHDATLALINRGHDFQCFKRAIAATQNRRGLKICTHVILGLPNEKKDQMLETARQLSLLEIDGVKLHLLYVVRDTKLEQLYRQGGYKCLEQQEYVDLVCDFLERLPPKTVIQRLTGDPHPEELIAPKWALNKSQTLQMISNTLTARDTWQGKFTKQ